jgi:methionyl-tRNA formyltransferase
MISLVFFGSSDYSLIILKKILGLKNFSVALVVTKIDKAFGRKQIVTGNSVAVFARDNHLPLLQIEEFSDKIKERLKKASADIALCVAFGPPFFDEETINIFPHKIVNIHPSPLPKYRGATPGPWQIINDETTSAVTFFQIDLLPDHGPIIAIIPLAISPTETADSLYQKAFSLAADHLDSVLNSYLQNPNSLTPQDHSQKSYFPKLSKDSGKIDWTQTPPKIDRFVRALTPWPIAWTFTTNHQGENFKMKIFSFDFKKNEPQKVQIEGKKPTLWSEIKDYYTIIK